MALLRRGQGPEQRADGTALSAVGPAKRHRLARAVALWLVHHPHDGPCRFDVLALGDASEDTSAGPRGPAGDWTYTPGPHRLRGALNRPLLE